MDEKEEEDEGEIQCEWPRGKARRGSSRLVRERLLGNCDKLPQFIGSGAGDRESLLVHC